MEDRTDLSDILLNGLDDAEREHVVETIRGAHQRRLDHLKSQSDASPGEGDEPTDAPADTEA
jgi:hypothetical protein